MIKSVSVIVPAYNEEKRITKTLIKIDQFLKEKKLSYEIIVVDDGSKDKTIETVEKLSIKNCKVISYGKNRGKGYAINFGVKESKNDWVLYTDADNSTPIEEMNKLEPFTDVYPVIIGSRYISGSNIIKKQPTPRIIISRVSNLLIQALILPGFKDTQCGFKMFRRDAANEIFSKQTVFGWGFDMELLRIAKELNLPVKQVGITWKNDDQSTIQSRNALHKTLIELFRIKRNSMSGKYSKVSRSEPELVLRFAFVGAIGTTLDFMVLNLFYAVLDFNLYVAVTIGFIVGAINNYILNSYFSFGTKLSLNKLANFMTIAVVGLAINFLIVYLLVDLAKWHYNIAKLIAVVLVFGWNYILNRLTTFKN
ncbi:bifunctional glycosyltransferase family 2/GtrA family protein [Candidatus Berkelbacteria bacterium]|nr:bifunctional glycosyltransferase family 2/GtrA family protein [Candidatus Berkelbacteria bacterium]